MADRRAPEPTVVHRIAGRLLLFELPINSRFASPRALVMSGLSATATSSGCPGRVVRKCDALLLAADFYVHIIRIPPA